MSLATPAKKPPAPAAATATPPTGLRRLAATRPARFVGFLVSRVLVAPIAEGRLADTGWPAGLRGIVAAAVCCYAALIVGIGASGWLRGHGPMLFVPRALTLPRAAVPLVLAGVAAALACLVTAALHARVWARLATLVVVESIVLRQASWSDPDWRTWASWTVAALLVLLVVLRWRGRFHWLEFVAALVLAGSTTAINTTFMTDSGFGAGMDTSINGLSFLLLPLWDLATPMALLGGAAMVELTSATSVWAVTGVWRAISSTTRARVLAGIAVGLVVVGRGVQLGHHLAVDTGGAYSPGPLAGGVLEFGLIAVTGWLFQQRAVRRQATTWRPDADDLTTRWSGVSLWVAVIFAVPMVGTPFLGTVARGLGVPAGVAAGLTSLGGRWQLLGGAMLSATVMLVLAWRWSGRGRRRAPMLLACVAAVTVCATVNTWADVFVSSDGMVLGATLGAVVVGGWALATRRMSAETGVALTTVLLLTTLYDYRDVIDEPLTALFAVTGVAASLVVGLIWRLLTDNSWTRADSPGFPRPSRVLFALASSLFAVASVATVALSGGMFPLSLAPVEDVGDQFLGLGLVMAVSTAALIVAVSGRRVREVPYGPRDPNVRPRREAIPARVAPPARVEPDESARRSRSGQPG